MNDDNTTDGSARWTPPDGKELGEWTRQGAPDAERPDWHTDAYECRMKFGIPAFDDSPASYEYTIYPDTLVHEKPAEKFESEGGTSFIAMGGRGSGKSTFLKSWGIRLMEANDERVIWRGSPSRSEWLAMAPWTTLWLPENAEISAAWLDGDKDETVGSSSLDREKVADADLEDVVRDVRRYGSVYDLLDELADHPRGTFNVVYPDPSFSGCDEVVRNSDKTDVDLPFVPAWETMGTEEDDPTPLNHWWFAFMAARVEYGPFSDMSLIYDEGGDLVPEGAADDTHRTQKKLKWARSVYADSRKFRFSIYWGIHYEENLHHTIRRECERWIQMPDKSPNPVKRRSTTHPLGMDKVPMFTDLMSHRDKGGGTFLIFDESEFDLVSWYLIDALDRTTPGEGETDAWLKIVLDEPETEEPETPDEPTLQYDSSVFKVWTAPDERRLYAKDPHQGYVDLMSGLEVEPLQYDGPEYTFEGVEEDDPGDYLLVQMRNEREGGLVTAARIPIDDTAAGSGIGLEDENDDRDGEVSV